MSEIAEHAFQYEERVAAVFQSQELLSKNISEVLSGLQKAQQIANGCQSLDQLAKLEKLRDRAQKCDHALTVIEGRLKRIKATLVPAEKSERIEL